MGGMLWMRPSGGVAHLAAYDGNGNVVGLVDGSTGTVSARYEYDPFGNTLRMTGNGTIAAENAFRFSTKRADDPTGLVLYEYRAYSPALGRWPNRDPIGEDGGRNLYAFTGNAPIGRFDRDGREHSTYSLYGAWDMFANLFVGDPFDNYTISDQLIRAARGRLGPVKTEIDLDLRKAVACGKSGTKRVFKSNDKFTIEDDSTISFVNMGRWQLKVTATCDWQCGEYGEHCCCDCKATCHLGIGLSKTYTFAQEGYNEWNVGIFTLFHWESIKDQFLTQGNTRPEIFISATFNDNYKTSFKPQGCK